MRTDYLVYGAAVLSSVVGAATIPVPATSHNVMPPLPLSELPDHNPLPTWSERLRGLSARLLGRSGRHGWRHHEQKHFSSGPSQMSRYSGDIVLRFNLTTQVQGQALVDASQILFLDVWSSTKDYVDIRLPERDVRPSSSHEPLNTLITILLLRSPRYSVSCLILCNMHIPD